MVFDIIIIVLLVITIILLGLVLIKMFSKNSTEFRELRMELNNNLTNMQKSISDNNNSKIEDANKKEIEKLDLLINTLNKDLENVKNELLNNTNSMESKLENIRTHVSTSITNLQNENTKKLDEMRNVVDEKLQKTLNERLSQSFKSVEENLRSVQQGLGEMQNLAKGVGDLKKVLSNVKTRGILGETQVANILEQILSSEQYDTNVITKKGSKDPVEFAIRLPGDDKGFVYLPIDSKFPLDMYQKVLDAYESSDSEIVKDSIKELKQTIKKFAKDINEKYIDVPNTTEFAIMFLPVEGLYAEVVKCGVTEELQRDYKVVVAGPTTMAALLNSLQIGFKTLAIQKKSSEVWQILSSVKTEFNNFETVLAKAQDKINQANKDIDTLVGVRTRAINRALRNVTELEMNEKNLIDYYSKGNEE